MQNIETGRSMIETLGTLAIIGVLSVGGIFGYSYGMDKYRAIETINDVNVRGIDLVRQVVMKQNVSLSEWPAVSTVGYAVTAAQLTADGEAYFSISGVPQRVCKMVYEGIQNNQTTDVEINNAVNGDASDCYEENNTMGFFFITNAGQGGDTPDDLCNNVACAEGYSCTHGICMSEELPQKASQWKMCTSDKSCGICEQCIYKWDTQYCDLLMDGTNCGTGKACQKGQCVENKTCENNSDCDKNYYCGHLYNMYNYDGPGDVSDIKMCIFAEFHKVSLSNGDYFYVSEHKNILTDAESICDAAGLKLIENFEDHLDIVNGLKAFALPNSGFEALSKTQRCMVTLNSYTCSPSFDDYPSYVVCVKQ
ncbi:MAG: hypothetical protein ACI4QM_01430 [Alphaproteobacteria bacterium]